MNLPESGSARTFTTEEILKKTFSQKNRREDPNAVAPATPEEYIEKLEAKGAFTAMFVGSVPGLGLSPSQVMLNKPAWLGDPPEINNISYEENCEVLVIGSGQAGTTAGLRCAELGADTLILEVQTWEEYDGYACDMATYNSKHFLNKGVPEYDLMDIYNEYMRKALGHAHPKIVRDYVTRSGEMLDWMLKFIPEEYIQKYSYACNYKGNSKFPGEACGQKSYIGMLQWRDQKSNCNMWPFVMRSLHKAAEGFGARHKYGAQAIRLVQNEAGDVVGCIASDVDGRFFKVNCKAVIVAAGDYGGNPDMRLDLCDLQRNLAWSYGMDRTDAKSVFSGGRDGSGIRMCLWAGGTIEAGPRASQGASINEHPGFPFGGCFPVFGPDGRRFMNETVTKFGSIGAVDMLPRDSLITSVTDSNWDEYCECQGYGHEVMDRSNEYMLSTVRAEMANYKTGPEGFGVHAFARYGNELQTIYAADTIEELGKILGYSGESLKAFLDEVERWNKMCEDGYDSDWGCDKNYLFPIRKPPFFGVKTLPGGGPFGGFDGPAPAMGGLCHHAGVCTDGNYNVLKADKSPIKGLYAVGNCCGQRYGVQYHTPTAGNSCGSALTTGYIAAEHVVSTLKE